MTIDEVMHIVCSSDRSDWNVSETPESDKTPSHTVFLHNKGSRISIKTSMGSDFHTDWTNNFPDKESYQYITDIYDDEEFVKRIILVGVNGGRAILPMPNCSEKLVSRKMYNYAKIFDSLGLLSESVRMAELQITDQV